MRCDLNTSCTLVSSDKETLFIHDVVLQTGQPVDGPQFGVSPLPWDIPVSMPQRFTDRVEKVRVPHSSIVKVQRDMDALGKIRSHWELWE